jgi:hypothetical protein
VAKYGEGVVQAVAGDQVTIASRTASRSFLAAFVKPLRARKSREAGA